MVERPDLPPPRRELRDAPFRLVAIGLGLVLPLLGAVVLMPRWLFSSALRDQVVVGLPLYPEPRLQSDTKAAMDAFRARDRAALEALGWTDRGGGLVHVPIGAAMRRVAERGVSDWPAP